MLRIILTSATILISITAAQAQGLAPLPGTPFNRDLYGNPYRDLYGNPYPDQYGNVAVDRPSAYQPYPSVEPYNRQLNGGCVGCLHDPYHDRYGDDD